MMHPTKWTCVALLLGAGLAGCNALKPQKPVEVVEPQKAPEVVEEIRPEVARTGEIEKLPQYFEQIKKLSVPELNREYERVRQGFAKDKSDYARLQLALFATLSNAAYGDIARALALLEPIVKERMGSPPARPFAYLLYSILTEQKKLEDGVQGLSLKLKEGQKREEMLQEKLDALKDMETHLMEREKTRPIKK